MASVILGNPPASGPSILFSGNPWSGIAPPVPLGGFHLRWLVPFSAASGASGLNAYVYLSGGGVHPGSGGPTITSGAFLLSGGGAGSGLMDGMVMQPGESLFVPKSVFKVSGTYNLFGLCDGAASGLGRMFCEADVRYND